jgi:hypothetical protein
MLVALVTLAVAVAIPVVVWLATSRAGCPGDAGNAAGPVSSTSNASPSSAEEYWTPERMRSARGAPMPEGRLDEGC